MASSEDIPLASIIPVRAHRMAQVSNPIPASRPERLDGENHEMGEEPASERFPKPAAKRKGKYRANQVRVILFFSIHLLVSNPCQAGWGCERPVGKASNQTSQRDP